MEFIFFASNVCGMRNSCRDAETPAPPARQSDARRIHILALRIGPCSRSAARKEKLPALVHKVTMVRATSSAWLVNG